MRFLTLGAMAAVALVACGSSAGVVPGGVAETSTPTRPAITFAPTDNVLSEDCVANVGDFVDALFELDSRLDVGLTFSAYSERVGDAKVAYDRIDINALDGDCLALAVEAESAYNAYVVAYNTWNDCISDIDCDTDSITPDLQKEWAEASTLLDEVKDAMP